MTRRNIIKFVDEDDVVRFACEAADLIIAGDERSVLKKIDRMPQAKLDHTMNEGYQHDYTGRNTASAYQKVDLAWLLKRKQDEHLRMTIRVLVWDQHDRGCNQNLTQDFSSTTVSMEDWKNARKYAKQAIAMGAVMSEVELRTFMHPKHQHDTGEKLAVLETYVPEREG